MSTSPDLLGRTAWQASKGLSEVAAAASASITSCSSSFRERAGRAFRHVGLIKMFVQTMAPWLRHCGCGTAVTTPRLRHHGYGTTVTALRLRHGGYGTAVTAAGGREVLTSCIAVVLTPWEQTSDTKNDKKKKTYRLQRRPREAIPSCWRRRI